MKPSFISDIIEALRMRQWHKNLLVFIPLVFAFRIYSADDIIRTVILFISFCLASSSVYLFNDLVDRKKDVLHPLKKERAVASGRISFRSAVSAAAFLLAGSLIIAIELLPPATVISLTLYLVLQCFYNAGLRNSPPADVIIIAIGFILRAVAGATAIDVPFSEWLLICTFFGAVRLVIGKRQAELISSRCGLRSGWEELTDEAVSIIGAIANTALLVSYTLYCFASHTAKIIGESNSLAAFPPLIITIPIVFYGIVRYEIIAAKGGAGDPEVLPLRDIQLLLSLTMWFIVSFTVLYVWR